MFGQHHVQEDINKLIRLYFDAKEDYRLACKRAPDDASRGVLDEKIERRESMHMQLQQALTVLGAEMSDNGTVAADFKRDWERLRGTLAGHGFDSALKLAIESDTNAITKAEEILRNVMPDNIKILIHEQLKELQETQTQVQGMLTPRAATS